MPNRLTIRVAVPFLTISAVLLVMSVATAWAVHRLHATVTEIVEVNVPSIRSAPELEIQMIEVRRRFGRFLVLGDSAFLKDLPDLRKKTDHWLEEVNRVADTEHEQVDMAQARAGYNHFF